MARKRANDDGLGEPVAGNGLLHRRAFLESGVLAAGAVALSDGAQAQSIGAAAPAYMKRPGAVFTGYGMPSRWRQDIRRVFALTAGREGAGSSRTPLQFLEGTITPNGLHFERHHNGVPDIDPARHELTIHGLVRRPLIFTVDSLLRYPMTTEIRFVECAGNSGGFIAPEPAQAAAGQLHGLLSCSEWTGVRLSTLLNEAGVEPTARWVLAEGADAAAMSRSVPLFKCMSDAMVALFQNGEPIRPEQGFPMRLLLPGYEGNANVKWLRRLKVMDAPAFTRDETSKYSDLLRDGQARQFTLDLEAKSIILKPSFGINMRGAGLYEISGLAWSGLGRITRVEISADGGASWADAALTAPVLPKALTRFRLPWRWNGQPVVLLSRATDERGRRQPTRANWLAQYAPGQGYHYNAISAWSVAANGEVRNVYA
jgi:sulfane dehydrogenase subunit SoxC